MAKKVILKDLDNVEILPITRGELIVDSSGKEAFHSKEFLATNSLPGLMSPEEKIKLSTMSGNIIDSTLSTTSTNPVQNKVVTVAINEAKQVANDALETANDASENVSKVQQIINSIKANYLKSATVNGNVLTIVDLSDSEITFTNTTYNTFLKETAANTGGRNGLVPKPNYNDGSKTRFLREDGTWVIPTNTSYTFANGTDGSFTVTSSGGSGQKVTIGKPATAGTADKVAKSLTLKIKTGTTEGTDLYTYDGSVAKTLDIKAGANITLTPTAGVLTISATNSNTTYTLSGALNSNTFVTTLTPSSGTATIATIPAMVGATSSAAGKAGLVPAPATNKHTSFLRGDGAWATPSDTHWTTHLYVGAKDAASNALTTNGNTYIKIADNSAIRDQYIIKGAGRTTVASDTNGNITINSPTVTWSEISEKPSSFTPSIHNHPTSQINALTNYTKATSAAALTTTDSLNTALGKLEYKAHYAYNWIIGVTATDTDEYINKWGEIVGFLDSVKEGTDIIDEFVTRKTTLTITGLKTFLSNSSTTGVSLILKNSGWESNMSTAMDFYNGRDYTVPNARIETKMVGNGNAGGTLIFYTQTKHAATNPNPNGLTERLRIADNGNVLIGTTNDSGAKLQVMDVTRRGDIATQIKTSALVEIGAIAPGNDALYIGQLRNSTIWLQSAYGGDGSTPSANYPYSLVLNPIGGNVGIGTTSPSYKLHVNGSVNAAALYVNGVPVTLVGNYDNGDYTWSWNPMNLTNFSHVYGRSYKNPSISSDIAVLEWFLSDETNNNQCINLSLDGNIQANQYIYAQAGFKKGGSSNNYVLLGGGGHKAISDFATSSHTHSYLPLSGGTLTGPVEIKSTSYGSYNEGLRISTAANNWAGITFGSTGLSGAPTNGWFAALNPSDQFIISPNDSSNTTGLTLNAGGDAKWRNNTLLHTGNYSSILDGRYYTETEADNRFVNVTGDTMTGTLIMAATNKIYFPNDGNYTHFFTGGSSDHFSIGYGRIQGYSNIYINADTDGSTTEYILMTAGYGISSSTSQGLKIGYNSFTWKDNTIWHAGNDGAGSGLDADLLDGNHASAFAAANHTHYRIKLSDDRAKYPGQLTGNETMSTFGGFMQNSTLGISNFGVYSDVLVIRSYMDSSGGNDNAIIFNKNTRGVWHTQFGFGSTTSWGTPYLFLDSNNFNKYTPTLTGTGASGTWGINITGNAGYASSAGNANTVDNYHANSFYIHGLGSVDAESNLQNIPKDVSGGWLVTHSGWNGMVAVLSLGHNASNRGIGFLFKGGQASRINLLTQVDNTWYNRGVIAYTSDIPTSLPANGGTSSAVTINYNNDSNSTYQMLWGSGNYVYGTGGIYCNPYTDSMYASFMELSRTANHGLRVGTVRGTAVGSQTGEFIHLYERVAIGSPSGWGSRSAPSYGLATYGGAWLATDTGQVGIGITSTEAKLDINGTTNIYLRGLDNTPFKTLLNLKALNSTESYGDNWDSNQPSHGITFTRYWTSDSSPYGETKCAGIYGTVSASWRGGLVFRTKNNLTSGGSPDITALRLSPSGAATFANTIYCGNINSNGCIRSTYYGPGFALDVSAGSWAYMRYTSGSYEWHIGENSSGGYIGSAGAFEIRSIGASYSGLAVRYDTSSYGKVVVSVPSGECSIGYYSNGAVRWTVGCSDGSNFGWYQGVGGGWKMTLNTSGYLTATGFCKSSSSDSYVLLGGGGHKLESGLSVNYANSAGSVAWSNVTGKPTIPTNTWRGIVDNLTSTSTTESLTANMGRVLANGLSNLPVVLLAGTLYRASAGTTAIWHFTGIRHRSVSTTDPSIYVSGGVARFDFTANSGYSFSIYGVCVNHQASGETPNYTSTEYSVRGAGFFWFGAYASGRSVYIRAICQGNSNNDSSYSNAPLWNSYGDGVTRMQIIAVGYAY